VADFPEVFPWISCICNTCIRATFSAHSKVLDVSTLRTPRINRCPTLWNIVNHLLHSIALRSIVFTSWKNRRLRWVIHRGNSSMKSVSLNSWVHQKCHFFKLQLIRSVAWSKSCVTVVSCHSVCYFQLETIFFRWNHSSRFYKTDFMELVSSVCELPYVCRKPVHLSSAALIWYFLNIEMFNMITASPRFAWQVCTEPFSLLPLKSSLKTSWHYIRWDVVTFLLQCGKSFSF
jgi:hypothetical protein